jgi:hypothetical protein
VPATGDLDLHPLKLRRHRADTSSMAPSREQGIWMLERLVAGAVRYGHDLAVVHLAVTADDPTLAARLGAALRGADALVRWEPGVYVALLPDTGPDGAGVAAGRLREAAGGEVALGFAHWQGDTAPDLLERSARALTRELEALAS